MRRIAIPALTGLAAVAVLAACSPDESDFKQEGEDFINSNDEIETAVGGDVNDAECEQPADTEVGTVYSCTASNAAGDSFVFTVEITGDKELTVQRFEPAES